METGLSYVARRFGASDLVGGLRGSHGAESTQSRSLAVAALFVLAACTPGLPQQPVEPSDVRVTNEWQSPIILKIPPVHEVDPALGTISKRTRWWIIDPGRFRP